MVKRKYVKSPGYGYGARYPGVGAVMVPSRSRVRRAPATSRRSVSARIRMGNRVRRGSFNRSRVRQQRRLGKPVKIGENSSASYFTIGKRRFLSRAAFSRLTGHNVSQEASSSSVISTQGRQGVQTLSILDRIELEGIKTQANAGVATENDVRIHMKQAKVRVTVRNQSNSIAKLTIYDISTLMTAYTATIDTPVEAWNKGYADMGVATQSNYVSASPSASPEFRRHFRINRVTLVHMEPGQQHEHVVTKRMNYVINSTKWANTAGTSVRGLTHYVMLVWHGALAHDTAAPTSVTYTPVRLDFVVHSKTSFAFLTNNAPTYRIADTLPTAIVDLDMMGENTDVDNDPVNA